MYLMWKTSSRGQLWVDEKGLIDLVNRGLPRGGICRGVSLGGNRDVAEVRVAFRERTPRVDLEELQRRVSSVLAPVGLEARVEMVLSGEDSKLSVDHPLFKRPLFWGGLAGVLMFVIQAGVRGSLVAILSGLVVYGGCRLALDPSGRKKIRSLLQK